LTRSSEPSLLLARWVSILLGPEVLSTVLLVETGMVSGSPWLGAFAALFVVVIPTAALSLAARRGVIGDREASQRTERFGVFLGISVSIAMGVAALLVFRAPAALTWLLVAAIAGLALAAVLNTLLKLSIHLAVATFVALSQLVILGAPWLAALVALPLLGWSRVRLKAHTPVQVLVGAVAGALIFLGYAAIERSL